MTGGLIQLSAYGPQNLYLTGNPQITFFIAVYKRHTNFSIESIEQLFHGNINFNNKFYCDIEPKGDLVNQIYLQLKLPNLNRYPEKNKDYQVSWVNSIGNAIIKNIDIEIGGLLIDRHYGQWMEIWSELTVNKDKRYAYDTLIGKHPIFDYDTQPGPLNLYVPLQFWFNRNIGLSLPLIALHESSVRIIVTLRSLNELYVSSNNVPPGLGVEKNSSIMESFDLEKASLWVDYIFLEDNERKKFVSCELEYLIEQLQVNTQGVNEKDYVLPLDFNHPVKELIWVFQNSKIFQNEKDNNFNFFDFSNGFNEDPFESALLRFEGRERFQERDPLFFRVIQPYQYHTVVPRNFIYVYSFSLKPEDFQPSGTCNFSRLDSATLEITLNNSILQRECQIIIYATSYNILKIEGGVSGLVYAN